MTVTPIPALAPLNRLSASIGADPVLVQAAGGNVSLKRDGVMWIKASGTWLKMRRREISSCPCGSARCWRLRTRRSIGAGLHRLHRSRAGRQADCGLRSRRPCMPSCRTASSSMCIASTRSPGPSVRCRGGARVAAGGLAMDLRPLSAAGPAADGRHRRADDRRGPRDGLGKHGLVVTGPTIEDAEAPLTDVTARLRRIGRPPRVEAARLADLAEGTPYRPASSPGLMPRPDPIELPFRRRWLYPDHVVFLGEGSDLAAGESAAAVLIRRRGPPAEPLLPARAFCRAKARRRSIRWYDASAM